MGRPRRTKLLKEATEELLTQLYIESVKVEAYLEGIRKEVRLLEGKLKEED